MTGEDFYPGEAKKRDVSLTRETQGATQKFLSRAPRVWGRRRARATTTKRQEREAKRTKPEQEQQRKAWERLRTRTLLRGSQILLNRGSSRRTQMRHHGPPATEGRCSQMCRSAGKWRRRRRVKELQMRRTEHPKGYLGTQGVVSFQSFTERQLVPGRATAEERVTGLHNRCNKRHESEYGTRYIHIYIRPAGGLLMMLPTARGRCSTPANRRDSAFARATRQLGPPVHPVPSLPLCRSQFLLRNSVQSELWNYRKELATFRWIADGREKQLAGIEKRRRTGGRAGGTLSNAVVCRNGFSFPEQYSNLRERFQGTRLASHKAKKTIRGPASLSGSHAVYVHFAP